MKYAFFVLTLFVALFSEAQDNLNDFALKRSLKQDGLQFVFTVLDSDKNGVRRHDQSKFYYWLKAQNVVATQGASSGQLLDGIFEAFYLNKQLARKGEFRKGLKHGTWHYWRTDGTLKKSEQYNNGTQSGKQQYFDEEGMVHKTELIRGRTSKSIQSDSTIILKSRERKTVIIKDSLGRKESIQNYKKGLLHGASKFYEEGKLINTQKYKLGELQTKPAKVKKEDNGNEASSEEVTEVEKDPGKLKTLWNKIFKKKDQDDSEKDAEKKKEKEPREKRVKKSKREKRDKE